MLLTAEVGQESESALEEPSDLSLGAAPEAESGVVSPDVTTGELRDMALVRKSV